MQNLTRYDLANSCDSDCTCHMMEQPEGVYVKFYDIEKILTAHNGAMLKIALALRDLVIANDGEDCVGGNIIINNMNAVVAQLQQ
jgi:hypothetical protein